ncbi:MoxR family ATPase [candidate division KSB1 bacterium]|nr:MoxR family ATPase [candidate division KSB1 bacterium]
MSEKKSDLESIDILTESYAALKKEIGKVIVGQDEIIHNLLISLFSKGHCLLVGVPGLAKTRLISTLASVLNLKFSRIQFTPDLMPTDITGTEILEEDRTTGKKVFRFMKGPIFGNIILADEINRTPPKTQAALLQAMQEYEVSAGGETLALEEPFFVLATQNPIEQEGTYPLPEAQLDRFMFNLWMDYPTRDEEVEVVRTTTGWETPDLKPVLDGETILRLQELVRRVPVSENVVAYTVDLVRKTRPDAPDSPAYIKEWISWGAGPRASQYLILGAKSRCVLDSRTTPDIEDVKAVARPVLRHRIITNFNAEAEGITSLEVVDRLLGDEK